MLLLVIMWHLLQHHISTELGSLLREHSLCVSWRKYADSRWKSQGTFTIEQSSVVFLSEMAALAWMEGYRSVCCQKLLYHSRAFMHRQRLKRSDCAGVRSAPYRLRFPHLITSACGQCFPQAHGENKVPRFGTVERQWRGRLCAHRSGAHSLENLEGEWGTYNEISF